MFFSPSAAAKKAVGNYKTSPVETSHISVWPAGARLKVISILTASNPWLRFNSCTVQLFLTSAPLYLTQDTRSMMDLYPDPVKRCIRKYPQCIRKVSSLCCYQGTHRTRITNRPYWILRHLQINVFIIIFIIAEWFFPVTRLYISTVTLIFKFSASFAWADVLGLYTQIACAVHESSCASLLHSCALTVGKFRRAAGGFAVRNLHVTAPSLQQNYAYSVSHFIWVWSSRGHLSSHELRGSVLWGRLSDGLVCHWGAPPPLLLKFQYCCHLGCYLLVLWPESAPPPSFFLQCTLI